MKRVVIEELLDSDDGTPEEVAASLADLRMINRTFGGARTTTALLRRAAKGTEGRQFHHLEVAAGSGDVPLYAARSLARQGLSLSVTVLDRSATHLPRQTAASLNAIRVNAVAGDALALPFGDRAFDFVGCSLFVHHLEPAQVQAFAAEALRVARVAVVINDLVRSPLHLALVYAGTPLYRSRLTRHDAPASVKRAYTPDELRSLLTGCGAARIEFSSHYLCRMGVLLWK